MNACKTASLHWLVDLASSAFEDYHPREGRQPEPEEKCLTIESDARRLRGQALRQIRAAAESGQLETCPKLGFLLYRWREFAEDDGAEVKRWTDAQLAIDERVAKLAKALTSQGWGQTVGDAVAKRIPLANTSGLELIMDKGRLRARVEELAANNTLPEADAQAIVEFLQAWQRQEQNEQRGFG